MTCNMYLILQILSHTCFMYIWIERLASPCKKLLNCNYDIRKWVHNMSYHKHVWPMFHLIKHCFLQVHAACRAIIAHCDEVARVRWEGHAGNCTRMGFKVDYTIIAPTSILRETQSTLYITSKAEKIWNSQSLYHNHCHFSTFTKISLYHTRPQLSHRLPEPQVARLVSCCHKQVGRGGVKSCWTDPIFHNFHHTTVIDRQFLQHLLIPDNKFVDTLYAIYDILIM